MEHNTTLTCVLGVRGSETPGLACGGEQETATAIECCLLEGGHGCLGWVTLTSVQHVQALPACLLRTGDGAES